jgi:hypothetical protein
MINQNQKIFRVDQYTSIILQIFFKYQNRIKQIGKAMMERLPKKHYLILNDE